MIVDKIDVERIIIKYSQSPAGKTASICSKDDYDNEFKLLKRNTDDKYGNPRFIYDNKIYCSVRMSMDNKLYIAFVIDKSDVHSDDYQEYQENVRYFKAIKQASEVIGDDVVFDSFYEVVKVEEGDFKGRWIEKRKMNRKV